MEPSALGDWLLEKYGSEYQEDIDEFKKAKINECVFLLLDLPEREDILKELNLSPGFKHLVLLKAKELKKSLDGAIPDPVAPGNRAVPVTPGNGASLSPVCIPLCTSEDLDEEDSDYSLADPDCTDTQEGVLSAWVPKNVIWRGRKELRVKFLNTIPFNWTYKGSGMNVGNVMSWANEWSLRGNGVIPAFTHIEDSNAPSDIRVEFTSNGRTESKVGTRAEGAKNNEATMWLDLNTGTNEYKKHLVIHEFGHALGLGHEHQRSDFWKNIKPFINTEEMKADLGVNDAKFKHDWDRDGEFKRRKKCTPYDPNSVMHYWFKKDWLTNGYHDRRNVEGDQSLSAKVRAALLGVHERHEKVANQPSEQDIQLLTKLYAESAGSTYNISGPPPSVDMSEDSDEQGGATADSGKLHILEELHKFSGNWKGFYKYFGSAYETKCILKIYRNGNMAGRGSDISCYTVSGNIYADGNFMFNKQYEGPTYNHLVVYSGSVEWKDRPVLQGKWKIPSDGQSDDFEIKGEWRLSERDHSNIYDKLEYQAAWWRDIGSALVFLQGELDYIQSNPLLFTWVLRSWLREMLTQWLQWAPGDGRDSSGFAPRSSLHAALFKVGLGQLALELPLELQASQVSVSGEWRLSERDHSNIYDKLELHAFWWRDIGSALGFLQRELDYIQSNPLLFTWAPRTWLREMLTQWLQWAPGDGRGSTGFATISSLHAALLKVGLGQLAQQYFNS